MKDRFARVFIHPDGFHVEDSRGRVCHSTAWEDVVEVYAYKIDLFSVDLICVGFVTQSRPDLFHEVDEEMIGYHQLLAEAERRLPGMLTNWERSVALPPFERILTLIYRREAVPRG